MTRKFDYASAFSTRKTPQSEPVPGKAQVLARGGGYVFATDDFARLDRFLILGSDMPTYYVGEMKLTRENAECVVRCLKADGKRTVDRIIEISTQRRAPKNAPALFALALAASPTFADRDTVTYALGALPIVARIGTDLFDFNDNVQNYRGWGRALRNANARWYNEKSVGDLAYQVTKYRQRNGWTHRDVLRLCHAEPSTLTHDIVFKWIVSGELPEGQPPLAFLESHIVGYELAKRAATKAEIVTLIREYGLVREMIPTDWLTEPEVWEALLDRMPMGAMIRNLANMTRVGLLKPMASAVRTVVSRLDSDAVARAGVHPLKVLVALKTYQRGRGVARTRAIGYHRRGYVSPADIPTWNPVAQIVDALDAAFYHAFGNITPTGKRIMLALDVSGSMSSPELSGMPGISPRAGSAAMALVTARTEPNHVLTIFNATGGSPLVYARDTDSYERRGISMWDISPRERLDDVIRRTNNLPHYGTDCALPMVYALEQGLEVDVFVIYTDSETWAGDIHPFQALQQYRRETGIPARLVVVGMVSNGFTIADPDDPGMLDVVGFDTATPEIISQFGSGEIC